MSSVEDNLHHARGFRRRLNTVKALSGASQLVWNPLGQEISLGQKPEVEHVCLNLASASLGGKRRTVKNFSPERQALQDISILVRMAMAQPRATFAHAYGKVGLVVRHSSGMEIFFQVCDHAVTWVAIDTKKGVIVADAIKTLTNLLSREVRPFKASCERFDSTLLASNVLLYLSTCATLCIYFFSRYRNLVISEEVQCVMLLQNRINCIDWTDTREVQ